MQKLLLYYHTVKHLRAVQIYGRLWFRFHRPRPDTRPAPGRRKMVLDMIEPCRRASSMTGEDEFDFLNLRAGIKQSADWNDPSFSRLWRYNLHYFDDLNGLDNRQRASWHRALIQRWIRENPPGYGTGWEPYPVSLRLVNWIKWILRANEPVPGMIESLAVQARWLNRRLEYHLLGNHLLANAKALVFSGLFFQGKEAEKLYWKGMKILAGQVPEQVLADGGHLERSPMYHLAVLEDLLDLINLHNVYGISYPEGWLETARRMLDWAQVMRHPDGGIPFFNDAALGTGPEPEDMDGYAGRLNIRGDAAPGPGVRHLAESGYVRLEKGPAVLFADIGPVGPDYLPGHAHADTLSFELSVNGRRVIVNGGTSEYGDGPERARQRSTPAHSTVVVDKKNSSEVWGGFRVARRARITEAFAGEEGNACCAGGTHDGFKRLAGNPLHRRTWRLWDGGMKIIDEISGTGWHRTDIIFLLAPGLLPVMMENGGITIKEAENGKKVFALESCSDNAVIHVEPYVYCPRFGLSTGIYRIRLCLECRAPVVQKTVFHWSSRLSNS